MLALARAARANVVGICGLVETCPMATPSAPAMSSPA
jgi:hypothetical protein